MANNNPRSRNFTPVDPKPLPPLDWKESPNCSDRLKGMTPYLIVIHRPVGEYKPSIDWLCNPRSDASAHVITEGRGTGVDVATQLVPWNVKSWSCMSFNSASYNIEVDDDAWDGEDSTAFFSGAHVCAWICHKTGIPGVWTKNPLVTPGVTRHLDLGAAGGGHSDPTDNLIIWHNFLKQVRHDITETSWRKTWGRGTFKPLKSKSV